MPSKLKGKSGITLIALIVTIIVLIILAGISINLLIGDNGIITRAKDVAIEQAVGQRKEAVDLAIATEYAKQEGDSSKMTVEGVLRELQTTQNSDKIYAMKGTELITAESTGNTSLAGASFYFPEEINGSANTGIVVEVDSNLGVVAESSQNVEDASEVAANIEVAKANITTSVTWSNGVPSITYSETTGANVTLVYTIGNSTQETTLANTSGTITNANITLGTIVNIFAKANGKYSDAVTVTVQDTTAPSNVQVTVTSSTASSITVSVTATEAQSGVASYNYYIKTSTGSYGEPETSSSSTHTFTISGEDIYTIKATAIDEAGNESTASSEVIVDKKGPTISSFAVTGDTTQDSITVSVTATDETGLAASGTYTYYIDNSVATVVSPATNPTTANTFTYTGLTAETSYTLKVVAKDSLGNITTSSNLTGTTAEAPAGPSEDSVETLAKAGTIKRWDTINYEPGEETTENLNLPAGTSIGYNYGDIISASDSNNWVVLDVNQTTGEVLIMPRIVSDVRLNLKGADGYNNAISALNTIAGIYLNSNYATSARSINLNDIRNIDGANLEVTGSNKNLTWNNRYGMNSTTLDIRDEGEGNKISQTYRRTSYYTGLAPSFGGLNGTWIAERVVCGDELDDNIYFSCYFINFGQVTYNYIVCTIWNENYYDEGSDGYVVPIITLRPEAQLDTSNVPVFYTETATATTPVDYTTEFVHHAWSFK